MASVDKRDCRIQVNFDDLKEPLPGALSSCMTFLDLTEGDTLPVVVVELHVGPRRQCVHSGIKIRYLVCSAAFLKEPYYALSLAA
jgi:hypothetical protein